ncbi:MAG: type III-A CRISPR-associated protein Cas10/Csm1 [Syntrophaceae bacterium]|nr:type III-A CRISPR-associated protein Cas10/Csm1 [Syntrophaceae bacterium]
MSFNEKEFHAVVLGALLHDIGKFYQRAGYKLEKEDDYWIQVCCKRFRTAYGDRYSHKHAVYSGKFIRHYLKGYDELEMLSMHHHMPENAPDPVKKYLAKLITLADWLASGERRDREVDEEFGDPSSEPLISIFSRITLGDSKAIPYYVPISVLNAALDGMFPTKKPEEAISKNTEDPRSYHYLWKQFIGEIDRIENKNIINQILFLLEKYTVCIPSAAYKERPDLSLFHHLKSVAAITACLYHLRLPEGKIDEILSAIRNWKIDCETMKESGLLLVGGDVSGIQDFIYSVTSEKALKGLRGRSFYIQLLSESIAQMILRNFNLPETNLLYLGGGHFNLLLPFVKEAEEKLGTIRESVDRILFNAHNGTLSLIIGWQGVKWQDFMNFGDIWNQLGYSLAKSKRKKFSSLLDSKKDAFKIFEPFEMGGELKACEVCGEEVEKEGQCSLCRSFVSLSLDLANKKAIRIIPINPKLLNKKPTDWSNILESLGYSYTFVEEKDKNAFIINCTDFLGSYRGYKFIASNTPKKGEEVMTLEDIANDACGIKKWGILRADVDNLGKIFKEGLGDDKTISRVCMLSYMLSLYFSARIDTISRAVRNKIYVVYSGGDDLFILGAWSVLPEIAGKIYEDFRRFTCHNLTLSGGIYIAPSKKFPVYQAANEAREAVEKAKAGGKDKITFLDKAIPWQELDKISDMAEKIRQLLQDYQKRSVPRSLLSTLYAGWQEKELAERKEISMPRIWRIFYSFRKLMRGYKEEDRQLIELNELLKKTITDFGLMPYMDIATRWADYLTRKEA